MNQASVIDIRRAEGFAFAGKQINSYSTAALIAVGRLCVATAALYFMLPPDAIEHWLQLDEVLLFDFCATLPCCYLPTRMGSGLTVLDSQDLNRRLLLPVCSGFAHTTFTPQATLPQKKPVELSHNWHDFAVKTIRNLNSKALRVLRDVSQHQPTHAAKEWNLDDSQIKKISALQDDQIREICDKSRRALFWPGSVAQFTRELAHTKVARQVNVP